MYKQADELKIKDAGISMPLIEMALKI